MTDVARNIARVLIRRHTLVPPVDIIALLRMYAEVEIDDIPFEFDGIALDLNASSRPRVILKDIDVRTRMRFTAAHELGHVIIPWHQGAFFDDAEDLSEQHWANVEMEREANAFASEILMPMDWLKSKTASSSELVKIHFDVASEADVSPQAAAINVIGALPPGCIFACVDGDAVVVNSGKSSGTYAPTISWGERLPNEPYSYALEHSYRYISHHVFHWWRLPVELPVDEMSEPKLADSNWRDTLDTIAGSLGLDAVATTKMKASVNGVVAFVNGDCKRKGKHTAAAVMAAAIQRLSDRPEYASVCAHPLFRQFLVGKVKDLTQ